MKYVFDEYGNKYEGMTKQEILASIGAGGERECVFTGCINYNSVDINYNYTGSLPTEENIIKLLACGIDPELNSLTEAEIESYLSMNNFSIHFYYIDNEIYVTNANRDYLAFTKMGVGTYLVYPRTTEIGYYIKSNEVSYEDKVLKMGDLEVAFTTLIAQDISVSSDGVGQVSLPSTGIYEMTLRSGQGSKQQTIKLNAKDGVAYSTVPLNISYEDSVYRQDFANVSIISLNNAYQLNVEFKYIITENGSTNIANAGGAIVSVYKINE